MHKDFLLTIYNRPETVFTINEIAQLFPDLSSKSILDRIYYFTKTGKIKRLHRGIYTKLEYRLFELANKLYTPAYISLETVLAKGGILFQYYETTFLISYLTKSIVVNGYRLQYRRIKKETLINLHGINKESGYFIASLERAFLDTIYIY